MTWRTVPAVLLLACLTALPARAADRHDLSDPHRMRGGPTAPTPFAVVPQVTAVVTVRLDFRDGTESGIVTFPVQ